MAGLPLPLLAVGVTLAAVTVIPAASGVGGGRPSGGPVAVVDPRGPAATAPPGFPSPRPLGAASGPRGPRTASRAAELGTASKAGAALGLPPGPVPPPGSARRPGAREARWRWPLQPPPPVVRAFAPGPHPWSPGHRGIDLGATTGTTVTAVADGTVVFSGRVAGRGVVSILHADGLRSTYEPLTALVGRGPVRAGERVGALAAGGSHCAPMSCLHLGARLGELYVDPLALLGRRPAPVLLPAPPPPGGAVLSWP